MTWKILETIKENARTKYVVECPCGYTGTRRKDHVDQGRTIECKPCSSKRTAAKFPPPCSFQGVGRLSKTHFSVIRNGAWRRGLLFDVSIDLLWELFEKQQGKCAYTGRDLVLELSIKNSNVNWDIITASVDRIDSNLGYTEDNVHWVHKEINRFKNNYSHDKFVSMCHEVVYGNPEPSLANDE